MFKRVLIIVFIASLIQFGCKKDELTLPASAKFVFEMTPFEIEDEEIDDENEDETDDNDDNKNALVSIPSNNNPPFDNKHDFNYLKIDKATLTITAIELDGKREQGKDVFMVSDFDPPLKIDLTSNETRDYNVSFDIPQGIYKKLDIQFYLGTEENPAICFGGLIKQGNPQKIRFSFEHSLKERVRVRAMKEKPSDPIVLNKDKKYHARVIVDARYMFQNMTMNQLQSTNIISTPNGKEIKINHNNNKAVFGLMTGRL
jgi:hypothetical protein